MQTSVKLWYIHRCITMSTIINLLTMRITTLGLFLSIFFLSFLTTQLSAQSQTDSLRVLLAPLSAKGAQQTCLETPWNNYFHALNKLMPTVEGLPQPGIAIVMLKGKEAEPDNIQALLNAYEADVFIRGELDGLTASCEDRNLFLHHEFSKGFLTGISDEVR